jgi:hypothetical protein
VRTAAKLEPDPEALKVREWRHRLQKMFLSSNKALPKEDVCSIYVLVLRLQDDADGWCRRSPRWMRSSRLWRGTKI